MRGSAIGSYGLVSSAFWLACQQEHLKMCELVQLNTNAGTFRWTTCNAPVTWQGSIFDPFPGSASKGVEESTDLGVSNAQFTVANTGTVVKDIVAARELDMAEVIVRRIFTDSPDLGAIELYRGRIGDYAYNRSAIKGEVRGAQNGRSQQWPYYTYQDRCSWAFGSTGCGFNTASITVTGSINSLASNRSILRANSGALVNSYAPGILQFGKLTITSGVNSGQRRTIYANSGDVVILSHTLPFSLESAGVTFALYPGCRKRLVEDCTSRFNNNSAFFGFRWIPRQEDAF